MIKQKNKGFTHMTKSREGFTLIEVIVTMSVIMLIAGAVVGLNYVVGQTQVLSFNSLLTVESANRVISTLGKELRTSRYSENGAYPIQFADSQEIVFYSDIDYDGDSDRVRYYLDETTLKKDVTEPAGDPPQYLDDNISTTILSETIRNGGSPVFFYYDDNFPENTTVPLTFPAPVGDVRTVQIVLRSNEQGNFPREDYILDTYIQLRLLKDEES